MQGLMLHCGAKAIDRGQLGMLPVPAPKGRFHNTRPFIDDVELITEELNANGLTVMDEGFGVAWKNNEPTKFFGLLEVAPRFEEALEGEYIAKGEHSDYGLLIGLRGLYDQTLPRGLAVGSRVFVCDNLAFSGEINVKAKQTLNIDTTITARLRDAIAQVPQLAEAQELRFDAYRNTELKPRWGDAAITELVRRGAINPSHVGKVIQEWDSPSHAEHADNGFSVWRMHNAVTEAIKPADEGRANVLPVMERTRKMTTFFDEVVGL